ncbi:bifunctional phosphoserine phosphatase/homoserine phosphotransferase ThrH [Crenobacter sp. SG2305]|uniref:bifunctional phosphoserine phosphatase/homoserine phosphotransferase ThrH n=1 Tax=Crenobacter oryzisoli TaxID=3056844 RepID=UPI0025AAB123|nr:bifunctional phosphoserine phosphatase/homoserine phosphotransferase ThrH [Crenobacter sp. SG2305]MDN0082602.1 bifunctional phosphoserine phosphatase/homoserine phosphotransferase ThrH [Crenobacter sp. SG2305]
MYNVACIDLEGVLVPEMWPHIAAATGLSELNLTTREVSDYARLVEVRIRLLREHGIRLTDLQTLVETLEPMAGACAFVERLQQSYRVVLVSDAFLEMVLPLWHKLGEPELQCHHFECDAAGYIVQPHYVRRGGKQEALLPFQGCRTLAVGDAFNDLSMLRAASQGFLFRPSAETRAAATGLPVAYDYLDVLQGVGLTV